MRIIATELATQQIARDYVAAWTRGDFDTVRRLVAADASVECNLGRPMDAGSLIESLGTLVAALDGVTLISETYADVRAILMYDCVTRSPAGSIRTVEYLTVDDALIRDVRRVYDLQAVRRLVPDLAM